jgi:hypothetical protein
MSTITVTDIILIGTGERTTDTATIAMVVTTTIEDEERYRLG